jgi:hypothetical protein
MFSRVIAMMHIYLEYVSISFLPENSFDLTIVAKVGGLQSQGAKGEAVVNLLRTLGNAGSGVIRFSRRVKNMASNWPHPLNSPWIGNQKWGHFDDFYLKLV